MPDVFDSGSKFVSALRLPLKGGGLFGLQSNLYYIIFSMCVAY